MKIAFLSDIHGNLPALQAVLQEIGQVDAIICCGDLVGYYPDVNQVCTVLRKMNVYAVRGNHDAYVVGALMPDPRKALVYRTTWIQSKLDKIHFEWLALLPVEIRFLWDNWMIIVRHASPWDEETYLFQDSPRLSNISLENREILVVGHTHHPMLMQLEQGIILNPGSVGQPRDWNPRASYGTLDTQTCKIELERVSYPVENFQERLRALDWDEDTIQILGRQK